MYNLNPKVVYDLHSTHPKMWLINVVLVYLNDKLCLLVTSPHRASLETPCKLASPLLLLALPPRTPTPTGPRIPPRARSANTLYVCVLSVCRSLSAAKASAVRGGRALEEGELKSLFSKPQ